MRHQSAIGTSAIGTRVVRLQNSPGLDPAWSAHKLPQAVRPGHARAAPLRALAVLLREYGLDPIAVMGHAGVDARVFEDVEGKIDYHRLGEVFVLCADMIGCPHLGLLVGARASLPDLGLIGSMAATAPTVGGALQDLASHMHAFDRAATVSLAVKAGMASFCYSIVADRVPGSAQIYDVFVAVLCKIMRALCGPAWSPTEVLLPRRKPADVHPYLRFFLAPVRFDAAQGALWFPASSLAMANAQADPAAYAGLKLTAGHAASLDISERVRRRLRSALPDYWPSETEVAKELRLSLSTLRRHMATLGTSYRGVAQSIRLEMARHLVEETQMPLGEVAAALNYAEPSVFSRAFRGWTGMSPQGWRDRSGHPGTRVEKPVLRLGVRETRADQAYPDLSCMRSVNSPRVPQEPETTRAA